MHQLVAEQAFLPGPGRRSSCEVNVAAKRDRGRAVLLGDAVAMVNGDTAEVSVEPLPVSLRGRCIEWLVALGNRSTGGPLGSVALAADPLGQAPLARLCRARHSEATCRATDLLGQGPLAGTCARCGPPGPRATSSDPATPLTRHTPPDLLRIKE